jgi:sugar phosphate isomerase/epimerase
MTCFSRRNFLQNISAAALAPKLKNSLAGIAATLIQSSGPSVHFSVHPRERIAIATYPFREFIAGQRDQKSAIPSKMPLRDFPAQIVSKFDVKKIEPWSEHFLSLDPAYLDELHNSAAKSGVTFANIAADSSHSIYSPDVVERQRAAQFGKKWIDVAAHIASPSVRLNIAEVRDSKPALAQVAEGLKPIADYAATKGVVVHLENDNPVSEDPFFVASVVDRVSSSWLHTLPDFGNSFAVLSTDQALRGLARMFAGAYAISHVKDAATTPSHRTVQIDLGPIFLLAAKHHYQGNFSMEFDSDGDPYEATTKLVAATIKNLS